MSTVETRETAQACVFEGGVVGMAQYENQFGKTVYKVCFSHADLLELEDSPHVKPGSLVWHFRHGVWLIPPQGEEG